MSQQISHPQSNSSLLEHLGHSNEPSAAAPYLRVILTFLREYGEEQIKQIPVVGPLLYGATAALLQLSEEEDGASLERRIEHILTVGTETQEDINFLIGLAGLIFIRQNEILARLQEAGLPAQPKQLAEFATGAALVAYRNRVARDYQYVDNRGIEGVTRATHAAALPLDDVYIVPRLLPERERENVREREKDVLKNLIDDRGDLTLEQRIRLEEEYAVITGERWRPGTKAPDEGLVLGKALEQARHVVVIGSPGVGKSAMTRYVARICALGAYAVEQRLGWNEQLTPIVLPLAAFADARGSQPNLKLRDFLDKKMTERGGDALRVVISDELSKGRAFILLDGVDEVPESHARAAIVQAVDEFIADHSTNRCLVTSRPYGYVRLAGDLTHFQLLNFSPAQVEEFVRRWQCAFERRQHPDAPDMTNATAEADALIKEIRRSPKVTELATNPLMLVIISLIRYERARLPEERVQLYNRAVNTLMDTWNQWRSLPGKDVGGALLPLDRLTRVWGAVAEWMRRNKPTGVVHRAELKRELIRVLEEKEFDEDTPEATAESYLKAAADRAGLLEERGFDIFAFWHPTFEEFLAAVELATPTSQAINKLLPLRDDPRWREVILLAVGYVGIVQRDGDTATQIVEAIAYQDPRPEEQLTHAHLRLAAACIADDVGVKRTLSQRIIVDLARVAQAQPYSQPIATFTQTVRALPNLRAKAETISALAPLVQHPHWAVRMEAARLFSNVTSDNAEAVTLCKNLLSDRDTDVKCHAALGLARAGDNRPEVWQALVNFRTSLAHIEAAALEFFTENASKITPILSSFLASENLDLRIDAANLLHTLGEVDHAVTDMLRELLTASEIKISLRAAQMLVSMGAGDNNVVETLITLATLEIPSEQRYISTRSLRTLVEMAPKDQRVIDIVVTKLTAGGEHSFEIAYSLRQLGQLNEKTAAKVLSQLVTDNPAERYRTANLLNAMGWPKKDIIEPLYSVLEDSNLKLRTSAANLLYGLGERDQRISDVLFAALESDNKNLHYSIALSLMRKGRTEKRVIDELISQLSAGEIYFPDDAMSLLRDIPWAQEKAISNLVSNLSTGTPQLIVNTARRLWEFGREEIAIEAWAKLLDPHPWAALGAWQKIKACQPLTRADSEALLNLTTGRQEDSAEQKVAREWIFHSIWETLEPKERTA